MLNQLKSLWGRRNRVKHLEACNLDLARHADDLQCERDAAVDECRNVRESWAQTIADMNKVIAERDALKADLGYARGDLKAIESKRRATQTYVDELEAWNLRLRNRDLEFREQLGKLHDDLNAAEALLDEAGEQINDLNAFVDALIDDRNDALDKLDDIARVIRR